MIHKISVTVFFTSFCCLFLNAQCLDKDSLWNKLMFLRAPGSSRITNTIKLKELLEYEGQIKKCNYQFDSVHAFLLQCIGMIYYRSSDYLHAVDYLKKSVRLVDENADKKSFNPRLNIDNYFYLFVNYDSLNNFPEMLKAVNNSISLGMKFRAHENPSYIRTLYRKVEYFYDVGDFFNCITNAENCENISWEYARNNLLNFSTGEQFASSCLGWRVLSLIKTNQFMVAESLLKDKLKIFKSRGLLSYAAFIYGQLAEVELHKRNFSKALIYYQQQIKLDKKLGNKEFDCKQAMNSIGHDIYFVGYNNPDKAIAYYRNAFLFINHDNSQKKADSIESLSLYSNMAEAFAHKNNFDSSSWYFQLAFDQIKKGVNEKDILNLPLEEFKRFKKIHYLARLLITKGDAYIIQYIAEGNQNSINKALMVYRIADQFINRIKTMQLDLKSRLFWRSDTRRLYENAISATYLANDPTEAFYFFERSRAVLLTDQLNMQQWLGKEDILQLAQLTRDRQQLQNELDTTSPLSEKYKQLLERKLIDSRHLEEFQELVKLKNPLYFQSFIDTSFIGIPDVRKMILDKQDALCELFTGDSAVYVIVITRKKTYFKKIDRHSYEQTTGEFMVLLSDANKLNSSFDAFLNVSSRLYQMLFGEMDLPSGRMIVSPDGAYFPFEALINSERNQPVTYLIKDHAIGYTYSCRFLLNTFSRRRRQSSNGFMGIAPVQFPVETKLNTLTGSEESLKQISDYFPTTTNLVGRYATKSSFLDKFYKYEIIQLYTHASDSSAPNGEPVIFFSDSLLYLPDLIGDNKPLTQLIVLSACETGTGKLYRGEGVFSFNRGFAALGIPASITNLWRVEDHATYRITELFYKNLAKEMPKDVALQQAKIEFMNSPGRKNQLPYYWAAPVLVGSPEVIQFKNSSFWTWIGIGGIVLLVISLYIYWNRQSKIHSQT